MLFQNGKTRLLHLTPLELLLWGGSCAVIVLSYLAFSGGDPLSLAASLTGVTSLILCAKGNPVGQALMLLFSVLYGIISLRFAYYGEMITYLGMTAPMALFSLISWLRHPFQGNHAEVKVERLRKGEFAAAAVLTAGVTAAFYFVLKALGTANLLPSTISVTTSFAAAYLTFRRSAFFALAYAANDLVLIVLWTLALRSDPSALAMLVCFVAFGANDLYGFVSWLRMEKRQNAVKTA